MDSKELVTAFNMMVEAIQKGQAAGSFTLQEAAVYLNAITALKPYFQKLHDGETSLDNIV
jgi:hypothetical protein